MARATPPTDDSIDTATDDAPADTADHVTMVLAEAPRRPARGDVATSARIVSADPDIDTGHVELTMTVSRDDVPVVVVRNFRYDAAEEAVTDRERGYVDGVEVFDVEHDSASYREEFGVDADGFDEPVTFTGYAGAFAFAEPEWTVGGNVHRHVDGPDRAT